MNSIHSQLRRWLILLPALLALQACNPLERTGTSTTSITSTISVSQGSTGEITQTTPVGADPLDRLLEMRSIQFTLTALQPDGTSISVQNEIDNAGNMHLFIHEPVLPPTNPPEDFDLTTQLPEETELYVVDGKAFQPSNQNASWMVTPVAENYLEELSSLLHGPDGPGLWLDLLPEGSLQDAGKETVGGFEADKYTVNGKVSNQIITGNLWYTSHTLVWVELHIPAALFSDPDKPMQGELKITLEAQKADVPPLTLPAPPVGAGEATAQSQATQGLAINSLSDLTITDRFLLPHICFAGSGLITTPGKVWVGSINGMVDVLDTQSGHVLQSIPLFEGSGGMISQVVYDIKYDGEHVWVLAASKKGAQPDTLFTIDPASGSILKQYDASSWEGELDQNLGFSPGKIWASSQLIDTRTLELNQDAVPWGDFYAYDEKGWMWITGNWMISDCNPNLWVINADDPTQHYTGWYLYKHGIVCGMPIASVGDRIWMAVSQQDSTTELWAYLADGSQMTDAAQPVVMVPSPDHQPMALAGDQDSLWMLAGHDTNGTLYQFDPQTGELRNSLELAGPNEKRLFPVNMALGEHNLWILMTSQLWRIPLE
jgi:hypothetical protein